MLDSFTKDELKKLIKKVVRRELHLFSVKIYGQQRSKLEDYKSINNSTNQ